MGEKKGTGSVLTKAQSLPFSSFPRPELAPLLETLADVLLYPSSSHMEKGQATTGSKGASGRKGLAAAGKDPAGGGGGEDQRPHPWHPEPLLLPSTGQSQGNEGGPMTSRKGAREGACPRSGLPHGLAPLCRVGGGAAGFRVADLRARVRVNPTSLGSPQSSPPPLTCPPPPNLARWRTRGARPLSAHPRLHVDWQRQHLAAGERLRVDAPLYDILLQ